MTTLASLYATYAEAKSADDEATRVRNAVSDRLYRAALALMEAAERGSLPAAEWMRAHLRGDAELCALIQREYPDDYWRSDPAQWRDPAPPLFQVAQVPVAVDAGSRRVIQVGECLGIPVVCDGEIAEEDVFTVPARVPVNAG